MPNSGYLDDEEDLFNLADKTIEPEPTSPLVNFPQPDVSKGYVDLGDGPQQPAEMNPLVKDHIMKKFNLGEYGDDARKKLLDDNNSYDLRGSIGAALVAAGGGNGLDVIKNRQSQRQGQLDAFDKARANKIQEYGLDRQFGKDEREDTVRAEDDNPGSERSKVAQMLASKMIPGMDFSKYSATKLNDMFPHASKIFEIEQKKLERQDNREFQRDLFRDKKDERDRDKQTKLDEKLATLKTPYGTANTEDDAKKLKEASEAKDEFDRKLKEMIDLRTKHKGGAILDREDVARGKQVSTDLMLAYKKMAQLGVLSKTDTVLLNKIIPEDPLEYNSPLAALQGQDPILNNMNKFREDANADFQNSIKTRVRGGGDIPSAPPSNNGTDAEAASEARRKRIAELRAKANGPVANK